MIQLDHLSFPMEQCQNFFTNPDPWRIGLPVLVGIGATIWWASSIHTRVGNLSKLVTEIREDIKKIFERLPSKETVAGLGPFQLTDLGKEISTELKAKDWARYIAPSLSEAVKSMEEISAYDLCVSYISEIFDPSDEEQFIKLRQLQIAESLERLDSRNN